MIIQVEYFAQARVAAAIASESLEMSDCASYDGLLENIAATRGDALRSMLFDEQGKPRCSILVTINDTQVVPGEQIQLRDGDKVAVIAPMSGG